MTGSFTTDRRVATAGVVAVSLLLVVLAFALANTLTTAVPGDTASPSPSNSAAAASARPSMATSLSVAPTSSPEASPTPEETPPAPYLGPFAAIVLADSLNIRAEPGLSGPPIGTLVAKEAVQVHGGPVVADGASWYNVVGRNNVYGWVSAGPPGAPYLDLRSQLPFNLPAYVVRAAAGGSGSLAWGWEAGRSDQPRRNVLLASSGRSPVWERASLPGEAAATIVDAAWGPAGWIVVTSNWAQTALGELWRSDDGLSWTRLPPIRETGIVPHSLVASRAGYLMVVEHSTNGSGDSYFSPDGQAWTRVGYPLGDLWRSGAVAVPDGFLYWTGDDTGTELRLAGPAALTDPTGFEGLSAGVGRLPSSLNGTPLFAVLGHTVIGVTTDYASAKQTVWRSSVSGNTIWARQTATEATLAGTAIIAMVSNGSVLLVSGYDRNDATPQLWRSTDGTVWERVPGNGLFGGAMPSGLVGGVAGFVGIGRVATAAGSNSVLWRSPDGSQWSSEADPVLGVVQSSNPGACPALPRTQLDWLAIPASIAVECFGDTSMTFTGWLTVGGGCGGYSPGTYEPAWLASMFATYPILLTLFEAEYGGCGSAAQHPSLTSIPAVQQWVTVTGHYDDPASSTCRWLPGQLEIGGYADPAWVIQSCQQRFVATAVTPLR